MEQLLLNFDKKEVKTYQHELFSPIKESMKLYNQAKKILEKGQYTESYETFRKAYEKAVFFGNNLLDKKDKEIREKLLGDIVKYLRKFKGNRIDDDEIPLFLPYFENKYHKSPYSKKQELADICIKLRKRYLAKLIVHKHKTEKEIDFIIDYCADTIHFINGCLADIKDKKYREKLREYKQEIKDYALIIADECYLPPSLR